MKTKAILKRRTLWAGFVAVLLPLLVLLVLQYRWLRELDHASARAHEAILDNYLEAVAETVEFYYRELGERALNMDAAVFAHDPVTKARYHFLKKEPKGAKRLFIIHFAGDPEGEAYYFDPACSSFVEPKGSPEVEAVWAATAPWRMLAHKKSVIESAQLSVDERDSRYRILLNPITDDSWRVVGIVGMILDPDYLRDELLPAAIGKKMPKFSNGDPARDPIVSVWDRRGRLVYTTEPKTHRKTETEKPFSFVFKDWRIGLASRHATPDRWARRNFALNIGLSTALAAALLGGVVLALRTASREMKLSQMKSDFVSNVSHELRTPLASIRVFGEFLRLGRVESAEKIREYGDYIETESRRLTQLINNLLDFASIESGRKSYRFEQADLEELIAETLRTFEVRLRQSGFQISFERPQEPLPPVWIDPGAIAQSLCNLLDNAVKYSNGSREIAVALKREGSSAVIAVQDHGIGVPRDEQDKIFDRFHRVSTGLVHDVKGSGLGLSIVLHIVEAHHGRVAVESRPGEGSTFSIHLPLGPHAGEAPASVLEPRASEA